MARLQEQSPEDIRLLRCAQHNMTTRVSALGERGSIFADEELRRALASPEDQAAEEGAVDRLQGAVRQFPASLFVPENRE